MKISLIELTTADTSAIGVRSLSAYLKRAGHSVQLIFLAGAGETDISDISQYPDYVVGQIINLCKESKMVGLSFLSSGFRSAVQITRRLKKELDVPVVWGGIHATSEPEQCLNYADMICRGEGEEALLELVTKMEVGKDYFDTQNFCFKKNGQIIQNSVRPLIQELDSLPFLDYDLDNEHFALVEEKKQFCRLDKSLLKKFITRKKIFGLRNMVVYSTMTSRGCPHKCNFCYHSIFRPLYSGQRYLRRRSAENIINELIQIIDMYDFDGIVWFADDCFTATSTKEIGNFSKLYKDKIGLPFFCLGSPTTVSEKKMEYLTNAGLRFFELGIQTGSRHTKEVYNRSFTNEQILNVVKIVNKFNSKVHVIYYDFILDNPWETVEDELETLNLILQFPKPYRLAIASFRYFPGSFLYEEGKKQGLITIETKQLYMGEFFKLQGRYINFLIVLYAYYKFPKSVIRFLLNRKLVSLLNRKIFAGFYSASYAIYYLLRKESWKMSFLIKALKLKKISKVS